MRGTLVAAIVGSCFIATASAQPSYRAPAHVSGTYTASPSVLSVMRHSRRVTQSAVASPASVRACLSGAPGIRVATSPKSETVGLLGDLDVTFTGSGDFMSFSFDPTDADAQASLDAVKGAKNPGPSYRIGLITIGWFEPPTVAEKSIVNICAGAASASPTGSQAATPGAPDYVTSDKLQAAFQENGVVEQGRRRTILDVACQGVGYSRGAFPYERYHIFECYLTWQGESDVAYRVTTTTGVGVAFRYSGVPIP